MQELGKQPSYATLEFPPSLKTSVETQTISTSLKENLYEIDHGRCLTCQARCLTVPILRPKYHREQIEEYQKMWVLGDLNFYSTANLVSLRPNWHVSYNKSAWTFVPTMKVLKKIVKVGKKGTYAKPYPGFSSTEPTAYTFIHFPTFRRKFINRHKPDRDDFDTYSADDGFADFPILYHHAHPYFVIESAVQKFGSQYVNLSKKQSDIFEYLLRIVKIWRQRVEMSTPKRATKRKRDPEDGGARNRSKSKVKEPVTNPPSNRLTKKTCIATRHGESGAVEKCPLPKNPTSSQALHAHSAPSYYDRKCHVSAWVIAAGPLSVAEDIVTPDGEIAREPYQGNWHDWCYPWTQPPKASVFSSNDWAMQHTMCKLTNKPGCWDQSSLQGTSDGGGEFDWETGPGSTIY